MAAEQETWSTRRVALAAVVSAAIGAAAVAIAEPAAAQQAAADPPAATTPAMSAADPPAVTTPARPAAAPGAAVVPTEDVTGRVVDGATGEPVAAAQLRVRELRRDQLAGAAGEFVLRRLPPGEYTLAVTRIGYAPKQRRIVVPPGGLSGLELELRPTALELAGLVVTGTGRERAVGEVFQPTTVLSDARLRRALATTVTATIAAEPGLHEQYNGPAANQPVIRGMGGDRVLVLEDGQRTGDMYNTAGDHAVAVDPLNASRIEVVRGPAGLLYGSNALGGVINVIRDGIPTAVPERVTGVVSAQGESVFRGAALGAAVVAPIGRFAVRAELGGREAGDTRTPRGVLESTGMRAIDAGGAASLVTGWGHVGASVREYRLDHGVPGTFAGEQIPGAHPSGVETESRRRTARFEAAHFGGFAGIRALEFHAGLVHYTHAEIEGRDPAGEPWVGTHFDQLSGEARLRAHHAHPLGGLRLEGAFGLEYRGRDLRGGGSAPGLRSAVEHAFAAYVYEEFGVGRLRLQAGVRYDHLAVRPHFTHPIVIGRGDDAREVPVTARSFGALSGSLAAVVEVVEGGSVGVNAARAFRAPSIGELYSDGPHLADYSFDIGNPALDAETGVGVDLFARLERPGAHVEVSVFANRIDQYIHYEATGDIDPRFNRFPVFAARGHDALFHGVEGRVQAEPLRRLVVEGTLSQVTATRTESDDALPDIPPLNGALSLRYERTAWHVNAGWRGAAAQNRVPRAFVSPIDAGEVIQPQAPTPGYGLWSAGAGVRWSEGSRFHTITLNVLNAFDADWRDHLSRTKEIAPQPGRNVQLLYRMTL